MAPRHAEPLAAAVAETNLGFIGIAVSDRGVRYATLPRPTRAEADRELAELGAEERPHPLAAQVCELLERYASGEAVPLETVPLDLPDGTPWQRAVWLALREIPRGETRSYQWLAARCGRPRAARAAGAAVGRNPIPLILPCHRVVASDGSLHGYGGGLELKAQLLRLEGAIP